MRKNGFPRARLVRQLELIYSDLGDYRAWCLDELHRTFVPGRGGKLVDRAYDIEDIQAMLDKVIYRVDNVARLS